MSRLNLCQIQMTAIITEAYMYLVFFHKFSRIVGATFVLLLSSVVLAETDEMIDNMDLLPRTRIMEEKLSFHFPGEMRQTGSDWWTLACPNECSLFPLELVIKSEPYADHNDDSIVPGQILNFSPVPPASEVLVLFRLLGLKQKLALKAGSLPTYFPGLSQTKTLGTLEGEIKLPDGKLVRFVPTLLLPDAEQQESEIQSELILELQMNGRRQSLGNLIASDISGFISFKPSDYLLWAGDLDGDGKPDFLVNLDFSGVDQVLFLSSLAKGDELVGEAGRFTELGPGC
jgi:hypothetical protein